MINDISAAHPSTAPASAADLSALRLRMRAGSGDRHQRLDVRFEGMHGAETPAVYHRFVAVNEACHAAIEPVLERSRLCDVLLDWQSRNRTALLRRDLDEMAVAPLPRMAFDYDVAGLPEAFGAGYVLEGSRLGARYLHRMMRKRLVEPAFAGVSLLYLASADEPDHFRPFLAQAAHVLTTEASRDRAVAAANAAFDLFLETERISRSVGGAFPADVSQGF
ncbi:MAG: biliverdin-producing heme oxygenase [Rhizobiaceae bacterium]|nr:biliverdin-producing heme oxygenase [Rhizobiaceae bacterium]